MHRAERLYPRHPIQTQHVSDFFSCKTSKDGNNAGGQSRTLAYCVDMARTGRKKQNVTAVMSDQFSYAWNTLRCNGTAALLAQLRANQQRHIHIFTTKSSCILTRTDRLQQFLQSLVYVQPTRAGEGFPPQKHSNTDGGTCHHIRVTHSHSHLYMN